MTSGEAAAQAPSKQPFERDGRWWFERDGELLVFDDDSGEWAPSSDRPTHPSGRGPASSPATTGPAPGENQQPQEPSGEAGNRPGSISGEGATQTMTRASGEGVAAQKVTDELSDEGAIRPVTDGMPGDNEPGAEPGMFWRCSICSAINGVTISACRMCFTPRP